MSAEVLYRVLPNSSRVLATRHGYTCHLTVDGKPREVSCYTQADPYTNYQRAVQVSADLGCEVIVGAIPRPPAASVMPLPELDAHLARMASLHGTPELPGVSEEAVAK